MRICSFASEGALLLVFATLGCARVNDVPDPPDVTPIVAIYDEPDGIVDTEAVQRELPVAAAIARGIAESGVPTFVSELLSTVRDAAGDRIEIVSGDDMQSSTLRVDALLRVRRVCDGFTDSRTPPDPDRNGQLDLRAVIRKNQLLPTVWGNSIGRCVETVTVGNHPERVFFDGELTLYPHGENDAKILVRIDGSVGVRNRELAHAIDFRLVNGGGVELRAPAPGGWIVFYLLGNRLGVRGANGDFSCSAESRVCRRINGGRTRR